VEAVGEEILDDIEVIDDELRSPVWPAVEMLEFTMA
jgi:hypothetical protein